MKFTLFSIVLIFSCIYFRTSEAIEQSDHELQTSMLENDLKIELSCILCRQVADQVLGWFDEGIPRDEIVNRTTNLCVTTGIMVEHVCRGVIDSYADLILFIADERNSSGNPLTSNDFCGFALYPDCPLKDPSYNWTLDLSFMGNKPGPQQPPQPPEGSPVLKVLQLTDMHVDPNYLPGGNAECGEPTCCRFDQGIPENSSSAAGYWGDYRDCDLPVHSFKNIVHQAALTYPDLAYVMFTGDVVDHGVWATTEEGNADLLKLVTSEIRSQIPQVPLLPVFGNHEPHPLNVYSSGSWNIPSSVSQEWLYRVAADMWSEWLGTGVESTLMLGGYYSYEVRSDLLVIVLNNNVCYHYNWWLMYDSKDPGGQLIWLAETLLEAEQNGQWVHILSHVSPESGGCFEPWRRHLTIILDRFENIISGYFYGHTHSDEFSLMYALEDSSHVNLAAFSGGSGTPYSDNNPDFKAYVIEADTAYRVIDAEVWTYNLTEANTAGSDVSPNWFKLYTFRQAYGTDNMQPQELDNLIYRMATNITLQEIYFRNSMRGSDTSIEEGCDVICLKDTVCDIVSSTPGKCDELPWPQTTTEPSSIQSRGLY